MQIPVNSPHDDRLSAAKSACLLVAIMMSSTGALAYPSGWPSTATIPYNLGGSLDGKYKASSGKTYDGTGYIVVVIDGAFDTRNPVFKDAKGKSKIPVEACFGEALNATFPSLCKTTTWIPRPLPGNPSAGYFFSSLSGSSKPMDAPDNTCRDTNNPSKPQYCHYFHGSATAGIVVGQPTLRWDGGYKMTYTGVAPGANVITLKVGGGRGTNVSQGWPINSVVDALEYVNRALLPRADVGSKIVAVSISANGSSIAGTSPCATGGGGDRIDAAASVLKKKGVAVVMAAGNDAVNGTGTWNCGSNVIPVGATSIVTPATPTNYTNISQRVSLFAPVGTGNFKSGDLVLAPWADSGSFYVWGTSFAAPQVAGAFAVLRQKFGKGPSVDALVKLLVRTGTPLKGTRAALAAQGASVLNIKAALNGSPA
ncbi:S8 family serine peptidase [Paraburkholderia tropica]|uniref:S8 family serine peptidase n=1 Tax=Paraburkholderia tropica TaxID=92647 RepID=UPI002ABD9778|nr:S8 family serine peptidase [Paraburkholderia tropica]